MTYIYYLGDVTPEGTQLRPPSNHWDDLNPNMKPPAGHDVSKIYLSPSIKYAGCNVYSHPVEYVYLLSRVILLNFQYLLRKIDKLYCVLVNEVPGYIFSY